MKASNLKSISFAALSKGDNEATNQLFEAGVEDGFFYLDLRGSETQPLLESVDRLYHVSEDLFSIGEENLMPYDLDVIGPAKIDGHVLLVFSAVLLILQRQLQACRT